MKNSWFDLLILFQPHKTVAGGFKDNILSFYNLYTNKIVHGCRKKSE